MTNEIVKLLVVPHGRSEANEKMLLQGQLNSSLCKTGLRDVQALAFRLRQLPVGIIYSSDLLRCAETAQVLADEFLVDLHLNAGLRGRHYGYLQGVSYADIERNWPFEFFKLKSRDIQERFETHDGEGEALSSFEVRTMKAIDDIVETHRRGTMSSLIVILVTHGGVVDNLVRRARGLAIDQVLPKRSYDVECNFFLAGTSYVQCNSDWTMP